MGTAPDPTHLVDEGALERALKRRGLTQEGLLRLLRTTQPAFDACLAYGRHGMREHLERVLDLPAGALAFRDRY